MSRKRELTKKKLLMWDHMFVLLPNLNIYLKFSEKRVWMFIVNWCGTTFMFYVQYFFDWYKLQLLLKFYMLKDYRETGSQLTDRVTKILLRSEYPVCYVTNLNIWKVETLVNFNTNNFS